MMKQKNVQLIICVIVFLTISSAIIFCIWHFITSSNLSKHLAKANNLNIIPINNTINQEQIILSNHSDTLYINDNMKNNTFIANDAEIIVIGTVASIDGVVNYNPTTEDYVMTRTVGTIEINKVLKGELKDTKIPFIKLGGIIPVSEFEKAIPEVQAEKFGFKQMSQKEKETKYISEQISDDIEIEQGKTYLIYLKYYSDYDRYSICYLQYGLREVEAASVTKLNANTNMNNVSKLTKNDYKEIKIKNNTNGEYETLDSILPESINS